MLRKKLRESLTARIFLLTLGILLIASAITFGLIAWATPMTYVSVMSDELNAQAEALANELGENYCDYDTMLDLAGAFADRTGAELTIYSPEGNVLTFSRSAIYGVTGTVVEEAVIESVTTVDDGIGFATASAAADAPVVEDADSMHKETDAVATTESGTATESQASGQTSTEGLYDTVQSTFYSFTLADREGVFTFTLVPSARQVNQAIMALTKVAPWLLCAMLLFSLLCAFGYSRYISRPILRLSGISQRMASLDFSWEYAENRADEIGSLGRNLNSLSRSLAMALGELREANAALQRDIALERELEQERLSFFSAASHELKTPVTILKGQLTGMLEGVDIYQDHDKYLARCLQVTGRMERLVQELLTISRMEAADFSAQMKPLDLAGLLREQLSLYTELALQKGITVRSDIPQTLPVFGDESLLHKALDSIFSNAMLYSPTGETVRVEVQHREGETVLTVENSGAQLSREALPHLFEAFYRVEQSRNRSTGGSGLGLYLTARILEHHQAAYTIENTPTGVCFTVRFFDGEISTQNT